MSEAVTNEATPPGSIWQFLKTPDIQFALGMVGIVLTMVLPLPPFLLDLLLSVSITPSFLILLVSIYVNEPLEFSTFPTILLITTLFRLGLNVATTRSILLDAPSGEVSSVVSSFGNFVVGGNYFVGFVIFIILVVINFIVITKGAGRVAEVGARFTLDAMPGKQMAIDAELQGGLIDRDEARRRRQNIEQEADFYGSMDGASKFVRGDAIASLIITAINIVVGLILGVSTYNLSFGDSAQLFTLLTVGDGLVSQIPALIISTAAGIIVTRSGGNRAGTGDLLSESLSKQIFGHPKAFYLCSVLLVGMAVVPGLPMLPFMVLGGLFLFGGRLATTRLEKKAEEARAMEDKGPKEGSSESVESLLHIDVLTLEVGVGLIPLVDASQDGEVLERIVSARKQFAQDLGIVVPMVMVRDNIQLKPGEYQILLKGNAIGKGTLMVDYLLAMDPGDIVDPIDGIKGIEPAYGLEAIWIKTSQKEEASFRGYTVVNCATVIVTHLTRLVEEHAASLLGRQETQGLIDGLRDEYPKVVEEVLAADRMQLGDVVKVLQNLLNEKVSIRDLLTIFETLADYCQTVKHPDAITRYVRANLGRGIIKKYLNHEDKLMVLTVDRVVEDLLVSGIRNLEDGSSTLELDPELAQKILTSIAESAEVFHTTGTQPIVLCGSTIRWNLMQLVRRWIPGVVVLAFEELTSEVQTESVGIITI